MLSSTGQVEYYKAVIGPYFNDLSAWSKAVVLKIVTPSTTSENIWLSKYHHYDQH